MFRIMLTVVVALQPVALPTGSALAQSPDAAHALVDRRDVFIELTPQSEQAIAKALRYLADNQLPSGAWTSRFGPNIGVTSLALLAFVAAGHVPLQGEYAETLDRGLGWILANVQPSGLILYADGASHGSMYEHALATLLLSEVYGMSERREIPAAIQAATRVIVNAQNSAGGWRYQPISRDADISVTVMQIVALRGAQQAGMIVPAETIENAIKYVKLCADPGGGFLYQSRSGTPNYARTGAGVCSLEVCGDYECDEVRRGLDYLISNIGQDAQESHYYYGVYYAAQAVYQAKDSRRWQQWFPAIREQLIERQEADGYWASDIGAPYSTAMAVLALSIPYRYLPIYQR